MNFPRRPKDPNPPREEKASRDYYRECHPSVPTSQHSCVTRFPSLMVAHAHEKSFQARRHNFLDLCSKIRTATRKHHRRSQIDRRSKSYFSPFLFPALHLVEPNSPPASPDRLLPRVFLPRESFDFLSVSLGHSRETDKLVRMSEEQKRDKGKPMG